VIKIVADTNILISALIYGGVCEEVLKLVREKSLELLISPEILAEFAEVLYRKFKFSPEKVKEAILQIKEISTLVYPVKRLNIVKQHDSDNRILECAVEGKAQYIISGDEHHLLPLRKYRGIKILNPAEFLKII
jgi:putative PIN family toxin of toxin-antitoxin system